MIIGDDGSIRPDARTDYHIFKLHFTNMPQVYSVRSQREFIYDIFELHFNLCCTNRYQKPYLAPLACVLFFLGGVLFFTKPSYHKNIKYPNISYRVQRIFLQNLKPLWAFLSGDPWITSSDASQDWIGTKLLGTSSGCQHQCLRDIRLGAAQDGQVEPPREKLLHRW